jgi:beta-phosphoglucomutase
LEYKYKGVIFDLDGVIVTTDEYHYQAWRQIADEIGVPFDRKANERLRGVSRMDCMEIVLEKMPGRYSSAEKEALAEKKNATYRAMLSQLSPDNCFEGAKQLLYDLKKIGVKIAIGSSSRNAPLILQKIGLSELFDVIADGNQITKSKPNPEVFLLAARRMGFLPEDCVVIADADAGIDAALAAGCKAVGVGFASNNPNAHLRVRSIKDITVKQLIEIDEVIE